MTIEEFIRARLDEDEQIARESDSVDGRWSYDDRFDRVWTGEEGLSSLHHAEHIARHDPARVLRQVAALRHVVEQYKAVWCGPGWSDGQRETFELNLRAIAAVWSDHPDYRPEWAPGET